MAITRILQSQTSAHLGDFASNRAALAFVRAQHIDSNGDGTGGFVDGQGWFDTTLGLRREFDGVYVRGRPYSRPAGGTIYVRSTGDDEDGDGSVGHPYATFAQALEDVPLARDETFGLWTIDMQEAHDFAIPDEFDAGRGGRLAIECQDRTGWEEVVGTTAIDNPGGVIVDTMEDGGGAGATPGQHGRVVQVTGAGWAPGAFRDCMVEVMSGNLTGIYGWIVDNTADQISFRCNSDAYTGDGGAGLADGDQIRIIRPSTTFTPVSGGSINFKGSIFFRYPYIKSTYVVLSGAADRFTSNWGVINNIGSTGFSQLHGGYFQVTRGSFNGRIDTEGSGVFYCRGDQEPTTLHDFRFTGSGAGRWVLRGRVVAVDHTGGETLWIPSALDVSPFDYAADPNTGNYLALYDYANIRNAWTDGGRGLGSWIFPAIVGNVTSVVFDDAYPGWTRGFKVQAPSMFVYCGAVNPENCCSIDDHVADTYSNPYGFEVFGTGNYKKPLMELHGWRVGAAGAATEDNGNDLAAWAFANGADQDIVAGARVPPDYVEGAHIVADVQYDTGADVVGGNRALFTFEGVLVAANGDCTAPDKETSNVALQAAGGGANLIQIEADVDITDADGLVGGQDVARGEYLGMRIYRNGTAEGGTAITNPVRIYADSIRLYQYV